MARATAVGAVRLTYLKNDTPRSYSDGEVEQELLRLFKSPDAEKLRRQALAGSTDWALQYHLSPQRANLLNWYDFKPGARVLEIGAGCGAITETLVSKDVEVTALELSEQRALVNAERNKAADNLEIVVGNLQDYKPEKPFDYVICIGVLEYAGGFIKSPEPFLDFTRMLRKLTGQDGALLLAIENRLGLKYFAGAREDHAGNYFFDGINSYPQQDWVRTFGKQELKKLLDEGGFSQSYFYYPFPDYKMPAMVFSDDYLPGESADFPLHALPTPVPDRPRYFLFSEQSAMLHLEANSLFADFANSFLVEAS